MLVIWDLETTGFVAPSAKILEIGAKIIHPDGRVEDKNWVLNNNVEIPEEITKINGFTKEIIEKEGKDPDMCLVEFIKYLFNADIHVTHNGLNFDIPFLINTLADRFSFISKFREEYTKFLRDKAFDTAVHFKATKLKTKIKEKESYLDFASRVMLTRAYGVKYNLGLCCEEMKVDKSNITLHRASGDVYLTYELYKLIKDNYATRI